MVEETVKRVLEEWKEDLKDRGLSDVDDGELIYNMSDIEDAIELTEKLTREEEDKATAKIQKTLIASTQLLNKQIIQYEIEKEHEKVLKIIDNIDDEEFAELFHKNYEKASLAYGWKTQEKCQTDFWNLPEANRKAMIGTTIQIKLWLWKLIDDVFKFKTEVENDAKT